MGSLLPGRHSGFKTVESALVSGGVVTSGAAALAMALLQNKWFFIPLVLIGSCVTVYAILWNWEKRPYRGQIRFFLESGSVGLYLLILICSLALQGLAGTAVYVTMVQTQGHVCICQPSQNISAYINLVVGAGALTFFESAALCSSILCISAVKRKVHRMPN